MNIFTYLRKEIKKDYIVKYSNYTYGMNNNSDKIKLSKRNKRKI